MEKANVLDCFVFVVKPLNPLTEVIVKIIRQLITISAINESMSFIIMCVGPKTYFVTRFDIVANHCAAPPRMIARSIWFFTFYKPGTVKSKVDVLDIAPFCCAVIYLFSNCIWDIALPIFNLPFCVSIIVI